MRQNNQFTAPEHRFFFPSGGEVECHDSVDPSGLPGVVPIEGERPYIIYEKESGEEVGRQLSDMRPQLPPSATVIRIATVRPEYIQNYDWRAARPWLSPEEFEILDDSANYHEVAADDRVLVTTPTYPDLLPGKRHRVNEYGGLILAAGEQLPSFEEAGLRTPKYKDDEQYMFGGVITAEDKLLVPEDFGVALEATIIDWCIANALAQNGVEHALLRDAVGGDTLPGLMGTNRTLATYLADFDARHSTQFVPTGSLDDEIGRFPRLSDEENQTVLNLKLAKYRNPRT
jgi:hypothetical protein